MIKITLIAVFLMIIFSLGSALYHLVKHKEDNSSEKTAKALTIRIGLSVALFLIVCLLLVTSVFKPHGIGSSQIHLQRSASPDNSK